MKNRTHLTVSRKNALTWLMALCLVGSAVTRIAFAGLKGSGSDFSVWSQIVLPVAATLLFVLITLVNGKEMFYKTAIPVWLLGLYYALEPHAVLGDSPFVMGMFYTCIIFYCALYTAITSGKIRYPWLLVPLVLVALGAVGYSHQYLYAQLRVISWSDAPSAYQFVLADYLFFFGLLLLTLAIRVSPAGEYHPTWGDRSDGRKVRTLAPMAQITANFQVERNTCSNLFEESFEITNIDRYIRQKRREGLTDFGITHVLLAAYVRGVAKYPQLNRFISGQKVYSRDEDIQYCMVIKKEMTVDAPDTSIKDHLIPHDTAVDVYHKLNAAVESVKATQELDSSLDGLIQYLNLIPSIVLKFVVWLLKLLDYFGMLPKFLLELSPFH